MTRIIPSLALFAAASAASVALPAVELSTALGSRASDQYLQGSVLFEWVSQENYSGDDDTRDQMWLRAELGTKIELEDNMELNIVFAYDAEFGDHSDLSNDTGANDGQVVLDEASILFKHFLRPELDVRFGRQPVNWNLRAGYGAFLYDSRANRPDVLSWDGIVANMDIDNIILRPYLYNLDTNNESTGTAAATGSDSANNLIYGFLFDYEPQHESDTDIFITANFSWEKNVLVDTGVIGSNLATYYVGTEWEFANGLNLYGEFAAQEGTLDDNTDFDGSAYSFGMTFTSSVNTLFGLQYDFQSGDDSGSDYSGFVAPHEGVSDLLIFEHERYGELSELSVGNLEAIKVRFEWAMSSDERVMLKLIGAGYELSEPATGKNGKLGEEYDLILDWAYDDRTTLTFFGAYFDANSGFKDLTGNDDTIQLYGTSIEVIF